MDLSRPFTRRSLLVGSAAACGAVALGAGGPLSAIAETGSSPSLGGSPFKTFGGTVSPLPAGWHGESAHTLVGEGYLGALRLGPNGVPLTNLHGSWVIHPTVLGNYLNLLLDSYETTSGRQPVNLARVVTTMEGLMARATRRRGAAFLRYEFPWHSFNGDLPSPWYSSFGQSKFPRVSWRLWRITGERRWLRTTRELSQAFFQGPLTGQPGLAWVAKVDANHCLWLDEYPTPSGRASAVFNGHYYALAELLKYQQLSGDKDARQLVRGAAETLAQYRNLCRNRGRFSHYFASTSANVVSYHYINTSCYLDMYNHTGWAPFAATVDQMISDWRFTEGKSANLFVKRGYPHLVRRVTGSSGANAAAATTWKPAKDLVVSSGARTQWVSIQGVWSRMDSGPMKNHWLLETPYGYPEGVATDQCRYRFPRTLHVEPGNAKSFVADSRGHLSGLKISTFRRRSLVHSSLRAKINGGQYARVDDGGLAGRWVPLNAITHF